MLSMKLLNKLILLFLLPLLFNKNIVDSIDIFIKGVKLPFVKSAKYLGVEINYPGLTI